MLSIERAWFNRKLSGGNGPISSANTNYKRLYWPDFLSLLLEKWVKTPDKGDIEALANNLNLHSINEQTYWHFDEDYQFYQSQVF